MITLEKTFSRERSLFYTSLWMESDRNALHNWLGYDLKNALYFRAGSTNKITVWYEAAEFNRWQDLLVAKLVEDPQLVEKHLASLAEHWTVALPYLSGEQKIETVEQFEAYYHGIMMWWSSMANMFYIPNLDVSEEAKQAALHQREAVEQYSDRMDSLCVDFWKAQFPDAQDLAFVLTPYEAARIARNGFAPGEEEELRKRLQGFGLFNGTVCLLPELERVMTSAGVVCDGALAEDIREFKGSVASTGMARGIVRLVLLKQQVGELLEGEILVTEMTNPDFVPAMKKAAAIITDEGGVTCHAAIVSREMHKPCIIGTKIATKVLKDGDEIEVDAEKGIVRILSTENV